MRLLQLFIVFLTVTSIASAQTDFCATPHDDLDQLRKQVAKAKQSSPHSFKQSPQDTTFYVPLKAHIVGKDDGTGRYKITTLFDAMCNLNEQMAQANMYFYLQGDVNYIDNTSYYRHNFQQGASMMNQNNVPNAVNAYFVDDPSGACGYYSNFGNAIAIKNSCGGPDNSTIAHELGHFFGMPHTFNGWEGNDIRNGETIPPNQKELVDGSNCNNSNAGDGFCDTPPDYFAFRWACPTSLQPVDPNGDTVNPDKTLLMSYSLDNCQNRFSSSQIDYMINNSLLSSRQNLLNSDVPNVDSVGETSLSYPPDNEKGISPNHALFQWSPAENATHYYLRTFGSAKNIQVVTTDTFHIAKLEANKNYFWKVFPFNPGNTCSEATIVKGFTTADSSVIDAEATIHDPTCHDTQSGSVSIAINQGGTPPFNFTWSNGQTGSSISGIDGGVYKVTITDGANKQNILPVVVNEPAPVQTQADSLSQNQYVVTVDGGTPPYAFNWSNGDQDSVFTTSESGTYSVTVSDANGCASTEQVTIQKTAVGTEDILSSGSETFVMYPNPLSQGQSLNIELPDKVSGKGTIGVYTVEGKLVQELNRDFTESGQFSINTSELSEGMYLLRINSKSFNTSKKVVLF